MNLSAYDIMMLSPNPVSKRLFSNSSRGVDLIVCYDAPASPIRLVQRIGRTGRKRNGRVVILVSEGKEEHTYSRSVRSKEYLNSMMSCERNFSFYDDNHRMVPCNMEPKLVLNTLANMPEYTHGSRKVEREKIKSPRTRKRKTEDTPAPRKSVLDLLLEGEPGPSSHNDAGSEATPKAAPKRGAEGTKRRKLKPTSEDDEQQLADNGPTSNIEEANGIGGIDSSDDEIVVLETRASGKRRRDGGGEKQHVDGAVGQSAKGRSETKTAAKQGKAKKQQPDHVSTPIAEKWDRCQVFAEDDKDMHASGPSVERASPKGAAGGTTAELTSPEDEVRAPRVKEMRNGAGERESAVASRAKRMESADLVLVKTKPSVPDNVVITQTESCAEMKCAEPAAQARELSGNLVTMDIEVDVSDSDVSGINLREAVSSRRDVASVSPGTSEATDSSEDEAVITNQQNNDHQQLPRPVGCSPSEKRRKDQAPASKSNVESIKPLKERKVKPAGGQKVTFSESVKDPTPSNQRSKVTSSTSGTNVRAKKKRGRPRKSPVEKQPPPDPTAAVYTVRHRAVMRMSRKNPPGQSDPCTQSPNDPYRFNSQEGLSQVAARYMRRGTASATRGVAHEHISDDNEHFELSAVVEGNKNIGDDRGTKFGDVEYNNDDIFAATSSSLKKGKRKVVAKGDERRRTRTLNNPIPNVLSTSQEKIDDNIPTPKIDKPEIVLPPSTQSQQQRSKESRRSCFIVDICKEKAPRRSSRNHDTVSEENVKPTQFDPSTIDEPDTGVRTRSLGGRQAAVGKQGSQAPGVTKPFRPPRNQPKLQPIEESATTYEVHDNEHQPGEKGLADRTPAKPRAGAVSRRKKQALTEKQLRDRRLAAKNRHPLETDSNNVDEVVCGGEPAHPDVLETHSIPNPDSSRPTIAPDGSCEPHTVEILSNGDDRIDGAKSAKVTGQPVSIELLAQTEINTFPAVNPVTSTQKSARQVVTEPQLSGVLPYDGSSQGSAAFDGFSQSEDFISSQVSAGPVNTTGSFIPHSLKSAASVNSSTQRDTSVSSTNIGSSVEFQGLDGPGARAAQAPEISLLSESDITSQQHQMSSAADKTVSSIPDADVTMGFQVSSDQLRPEYGTSDAVSEYIQHTASPDVLHPEHATNDTPRNRNVPGGNATVGNMEYVNSADLVVKEDSDGIQSSELVSDAVILSSGGTEKSGKTAPLTIDDISIISNRLSGILNVRSVNIQGDASSRNSSNNSFLFTPLNVTETPCSLPESITVADGSEEPMVTDDGNNSIASTSLAKFKASIATKRRENPLDATSTEEQQSTSRTGSTEVPRTGIDDDDFDDDAMLESMIIDDSRIEDRQGVGTDTGTDKSMLDMSEAINLIYADSGSNNLPDNQQHLSDKHIAKDSLMPMRRPVDATCSTGGSTKLVTTAVLGTLRKENHLSSEIDTSGKLTHNDDEAPGTSVDAGTSTPYHAAPFSALGRSRLNTPGLQNISAVSVDSPDLISPSQGLPQARSRMMQRVELIKPRTICDAESVDDDDDDLLISICEAEKKSPCSATDTITGEMSENAGVLLLGRTSGTSPGNFDESSNLQVPPSPIAASESTNKGHEVNTKNDPLNVSSADSDQSTLNQSGLIPPTPSASPRRTVQCSLRPAPFLSRSAVSNVTSKGNCPSTNLSVVPKGTGLGLNHPTTSRSPAETVVASDGRKENHKTPRGEHSIYSDETDSNPSDDDDEDIILPSQPAAVFSATLNNRILSTIPNQVKSVQSFKNTQLPMVCSNANARTTTVVDRSVIDNYCGSVNKTNPPAVNYIRPRSPSPSLLSKVGSLTTMQVAGTSKKTNNIHQTMISANSRTANTHVSLPKNSILSRAGPSVFCRTDQPSTSRVDPNVISDERDSTSNRQLPNNAAASGRVSSGITAASLSKPRVNSIYNVPKHRSSLQQSASASTTPKQRHSEYAQSTDVSSTSGRNQPGRSPALEPGAAWLSKNESINEADDDDMLLAAVTLAEKRENFGGDSGIQPEGRQTGRDVDSIEIKDYTELFDESGTTESGISPVEEQTSANHTGFNSMRRARYFNSDLIDHEAIEELRQDDARTTAVAMDDEDGSQMDAWLQDGFVDFNSQPVMNETVNPVSDTQMQRVYRDSVKSPDGQAGNSGAYVLRYDLIHEEMPDNVFSQPPRPSEVADYDVNSFCVSNEDADVPASQAHELTLLEQQLEDKKRAAQRKRQQRSKERAEGAKQRRRVVVAEDSSDDEIFKSVP